MSNGLLDALYQSIVFDFESEQRFLLSGHFWVFER